MSPKSDVVLNPSPCICGHLRSMDTLMLNVNRVIEAPCDCDPFHHTLISRLKKLHFPDSMDWYGTQTFQSRHLLSRK